MQRIGLLGGTFNPVHHGHLQLATGVLNRTQLDQILFIPAATPPHKDDADLADISHRLRMLEWALTTCPDFFLSTIECTSPGPAYTYDTLAKLRNQGAGRQTYYIIIGFDAFLEIESWYRWQDLLQTANFILADRPGFSSKKVQEILIRNQFHQRGVHDTIWYKINGSNTAQLVACKTAPISSSEIREQIKHHKNWQPLVPEEVGQYIVAHQLYRVSKP